MYDDDDLVTLPGLLDLLNHYATLGQPDRHIWHDRLMVKGDLDARALTRLHGELIAGGWIEQNTGYTRPGVAGCYRVTPAGLRLLRGRDEG